MIDEALAQFRAHRQNINRYRSLLQTSLTEIERSFIERRIAEEEAAMSALAFASSPPNAPERRHYSRRGIAPSWGIPLWVQASVDDHTLSVNTETAKEAFAKAFEWKVAQFANVSISDGT
jgi:hypothetical protein